MNKKSKPTKSVRNVTLKKRIKQKLYFVNEGDKVLAGIEKAKSILELALKHNNLMLIAVVRTEKPSNKPKITSIDAVAVASGALEADVRNVINQSLLKFGLVPDPKDFINSMNKKNENN